MTSVYVSRSPYRYLLIGLVINVYEIKNIDHCIETGGGYHDYSVRIYISGDLSSGYFYVMQS